MYIDGRDPVISLCDCRSVETVDLCCRRRIEAVGFSDEGTGNRVPEHILGGASVRRVKMLRCHYRKIVTIEFFKIHGNSCHSLTTYVIISARDH